jgi:hypothetical protein
MTALSGSHSTTWRQRPWSTTASSATTSPSNTRPDPGTGSPSGRHFQSRSFADRQAALDWITELTDAAEQGLNPDRFDQTLADYGESVLELALRGLDPKTTFPIWPAGGTESFRRSGTFRRG